MKPLDQTALGEGSERESEPYLDRLRDELRFLQCPACQGRRLSLTPDSVECEDCGSVYVLEAQSEICALLNTGDGSRKKSEIRAFWGDLYQQLYAKNDAAMTPQMLESQIDELEDLFEKRQQSCVVEVPIADLSCKRVLEIGSGGGGHSCIFKRHGAHVTAIDITPERVASTAQKLNMLSGGRGIAFQADAEILPFADDSFDIVYSNGVLHHSENTVRCIAEARRVLRPGGIAIIMLYSRYSATFMFNVIPRGIVTGEMFRWPEAEWIGRLTEGKPKFGQTRNPITRVYSRREMERLFADFEIQSLRKWSYQFDNLCIPRLSQIRRAVMRALGFAAHPGGTIVYGRPIVPESAIERWLGKYLGFAWSIAARKPTT